MTWRSDLLVTPSSPAPKVTSTLTAGEASRALGETGTILQVLRPHPHCPKLLLLRSSGARAISPLLKMALPLSQIPLLLLYPRYYPFLFLLAIFDLLDIRFLHVQLFYFFPIWRFFQLSQLPFIRALITPRFALVEFSKRIPTFLPRQRLSLIVPEWQVTRKRR